MTAGGPSLLWISLSPIPQLWAGSTGGPRPCGKANASAFWAELALQCADWTSLESASIGIHASTAEKCQKHGWPELVQSWHRLVIPAALHALK